MPSFTRREVLSGLAGSAATLLCPRANLAASAPVSPVAVARCRDYAGDLMPTVQAMFDQLGGLGRLVKAKTVAIKLNLNGGAHTRVGHLPVGDTHFPNPSLTCVILHLMGRAGAKRIRLLESAWTPGGIEADSLEEHMLQCGWEPMDFVRSTNAKVEFENTNHLGKARNYVRFAVPGGGRIYPAYDLNHSYADCDVFVTLGKPKDHETTGVTLSIKNMFGVTPLTIYGGKAPADEPGRVPVGSRIETLHYGRRQPPKSAPQEIDPNSTRDDHYRLPHIITDLALARPIHLAIIDGVKSQAGHQNPGPHVDPVEPGFLIMGANPVSTDAVAMAAMNYDPMAARGVVPFDVPCENTLQLAEEKGVGARDLGRIEILGTPVRDVVFDFKVLRARRSARRKRA